MVSRLAPFQHALVERLSELGIAYGTSPIVEGPGKRYFEDSVRGGKGIGSRFLLVVGNEAEPSTKTLAQQLVEQFAESAELGSDQHPGIALVRPDGYIAYSTNNADGPAELRSVRALWERQTG